jgi:hypothetical protein
VISDRGRDPAKASSCGKAASGSPAADVELHHCAMPVPILGGIHIQPGCCHVRSRMFVSRSDWLIDCLGVALLEVWTLQSLTERCWLPM